MQNFRFKEFVRIPSLFAKKQTKVFLQIVFYFVREEHSRAANVWVQFLAFKYSVHFVGFL